MGILEGESEREERGNLSGRKGQTEREEGVFQKDGAGEFFPRIMAFEVLKGEEMEWPAYLDEYEKLVIRMNTPRFVPLLYVLP